MNTQPLRILFVEDLPTDQELAAWQLRDGGLDFTSIRVETSDSFLQALDDFQPDLIISDYSMPEFDGMRALKLTQQLNRDIPFILLTGSMNEETAVDCIKAGASDYVIKEHIHRLPFAVNDALRKKQVRNEKEQTEDRLRASEARYRSLFENSPIALWEEDFSALKRHLDDLQSGGVKDFATYFLEHPEEVVRCAGLVKVLDVNKATLELFGASSKDEMFTNLASIVPADHFEHFRNEFVLIASGVTQFSIEVINRTIDGRIINLNLNLATVPGYDNDLSKVIISMVDITARRQAESTLNARNRELMILNTIAFELAQAQSAEEMWRIVAREFKEITSGVATIFGTYDPVEREISIRHVEIEPDVMKDLMRALGGKHLTETKFPINANTYHDFIQNTVGYWYSLNEATFGVIPKQVGQFIQKVRGIDRFLGITFVLDDELYGTALSALLAETPNPSPELINSFVQIVSVSLRRLRVEEALRTEQYLMRTLLDTLPDSIYFKDIQSRFIRINQFQARKLGGNTPEEILGKTDFDFFSPEHAQAAYDDEQKIIRTGRALINIEEYETYVDHPPIWVMTTKLPLYQKGEIVGTFGISRDITERKHQEAEILKNNQQLNLLYKAGKQLSQSLDLEKVYLSFYQQISSIMKCDTLYIAGYDRQSELIRASFAVMDGKPVDVGQFPTIPLEPEGYGIQSLVIRSGKSRMINNYPEALKQTNTNYYEGGIIFAEEAIPEDQAVTQSSLIIPILLNNEVTGVVQIQSCEKNAYSTENLNIAEALVSQIAVAANNAMLYQQSLNEINARTQAETSLRIHARRQEQMAALGRELAATQDLEIIYRTAERYLKEMIDCPNFGITLFDPQNLLLVAAYFVTDGVVIDPATLPPLPFNPEYSSSGRSEAIASKTPVIVYDLADRRRARGGMLVGSEQVPETAIYLPMLIADMVIGLLDLQSYQKNAYTAEDSKWLSMVANQVGLAIQNALQFAETQKRVAELLVMHNIDQAITTNNDSVKAYQEILEQITTLPFADAADIFSFDPQEKILTYAAGIGFFSSIVPTNRLRLGEGLAGKTALEKQSLHLLNPEDEIPDIFHSPLWEKEGFAAYIGLPLHFYGELKGVLEIFSRKPVTMRPQGMNFMISLAQQVAIAMDNIQLFQGMQQANTELLQAYDATIAGWSQAMDLRDKETEGHTERVTNLTLEIARSLGLSEEKLVHARRGALLHDIGKLGVPDHILHKPGPLTDEEWSIMKQHPVFAYRMLASIDFLRPAMAIPYCHHEKWDGTGYPRGLKGQEIPLEARIFALVDVYDALTSDRPYRAAWSQEKTLAYILNQSGKQFDSEITEAFLVLLRKLLP